MTRKKPAASKSSLPGWIWSQESDLRAGPVRNGSTTISLKSPVFPCDKIYAQVEVVSKKPSKRGGEPVTYRFQVTNQEGTLIAEGVSTCLFTGKPAE
jgi:acyl dehydratase